MNSSDNPPDYNPDIINNQLITTFGTTTAPNNFAFGSVNVRPTPQQHLEHTFNTTDLTQEAIELAIDDAPGLDVHTIGINQEQIVGDGAPINESALTIINWGKYRLRTLGLHQIATADNSNNWVVPALMEVSIPLIQNQVINHSGTYRIVQRTIEGETGLVIEEYIPEPEPEEEPQENNNNTRFMIIDEENNNNNGQMVLRGQSNVRGLPDPTGEDIEGTFDINIPPPTITDAIDSNGYYKFNGNSLISGTDQDYNINVNVQSSTPSFNNSVSKIEITGGNSAVTIADNNTNTDWTYYSSSTNLTITNNTEAIIINKHIYDSYMNLDSYYEIKIISNFNSNSTFDIDRKSWVYNKEMTSVSNSAFPINFRNSDNKLLLTGRDAKYNDNISNAFTINENLINFNGISWMTFN